MWIKHNSELYNLAQYRAIYKTLYDPYIILLDLAGQDTRLEFDSEEIRNAYFTAIERTIFNLGNSYD